MRLNINKEKSMKEILAPVGNKEMLITAINSGADAVYLGASSFNARMKADNFDDFNLEESVKLAHLFGKKVYLTLNTLVNDSEIEKLIDTIILALNCKVDAFIVQDYGTSYLLKKYFSGAVLHASTQMGVHNKLGAIASKKLGFSRVVLSREATIQDIKDIKTIQGLEIEYFVHGALCVCFSGNCYLSSVVKNKSGNRGECLQLCRLFYKAKSTSVKNDDLVDSGYMLSTRDLCYIDRIKELCECGVDSFKIEGRLKRPSYVQKTVMEYQKALNGEKITKKDIDELRLVFSRGEFNKGEYLNNNNSNIINNQTQSHMGLKIGKVVKTEKFKDLHKIFIDTRHILKKGDGLKFVSGDGFVNSMGVGNVEKYKNLQVVYSKTYPTENDDVYLTVDSDLENNIIGDKKIAIDMHFVAKIGQKPQLCVDVAENVDSKNFGSQNDNINLCSDYLFKKDYDCKDFATNITGEFVCEKSNGQGVTEQNIIKNLSKLGDTHFAINNITVSVDENLFMPLVEINKIRRNAVMQLTNKIVDNNSKHYNIETNIKHSIMSELNDIKSQLKCGYVNLLDLFNSENKSHYDNNMIKGYASDNFINENMSQQSKQCANEEFDEKHQNVSVLSDKISYIYDIKDKVKDDSEIVIVSPSVYNSEYIQNIIENVSHDFKGDIYLDLPLIENYADLKKLMLVLDTFKDIGVVVNNVYGMELVNNRKVILGVYLNISNSFAVKNLSQLAIQNNAKSVLAFESKEYFCQPLGLLKYNGKFALMTMKHCPFKLIYGNDCKHCTFSKGLKYEMQGGQKFIIDRKKIENCYFLLYQSE